MLTSQPLSLLPTALLLLLLGSEGEGKQELLPQDYDNTLRPTPPDGGPVRVGISFNIKGIYEVNLHQMTILLAMYFRMSWLEPRVNLSGDGLIPLHPAVARGAWLPDLYIHEARDVGTFRMVEDVEGIYITPPNKLLFSMLLQTRLACPMVFSKYPFDVQTCPIRVSSYKYGESDLLLEWLPLGVSADEAVADQLPGYDFTLEWGNITTKHWCSSTANCTFDPTSIGQARLVLARRYSLHVLTAYIPSSLFVAVAWASFFWPPDVIPGRTVLIITSLLTVVSMYGAVEQKSPETSYLKAVDAWLVMCIVLVVLTLFQYAVIITLRRRETGLGRRNGSVAAEITPVQRRKSTAASMGRLGSEASPNTSPISLGKDRRQRGRLGDSGGSLEKWEDRVERAGRLGLPALFVFCNIVYWSAYMSYPNAS